jgi:uncharacterized protein (UPF0276 family)
LDDLRGARGIGYRPELAGELLSAPGAVDFIEIVAETCFADERLRREAIALSEMWPVVPHGVKLSLGSAEGIDTSKARRLGGLARALGAPAVTEHVALTTASGREIGHLTPVPRCSEVVRVVARNVAQARRHLPDIPFLLENIATPFALPGDAMSEPEFYGEVSRAAGCQLLLDVANLYANAVNAQLDPVAIIRAFPLEQVGMLHIAGGVFEDGFYLDSHAHAVPDAVFELLAVVFDVRPDLPIVLERDAHFDDGLSPLVTELDRAGRARTFPLGLGAESVRGPSEAPANRGGYDHEPERLVHDQAELARLLTDTAPADGELARAIDEAGIARARRILRRKRVDRALGLLTSLGPRREEIRPLAESVIASAGRGSAMPSVLDAVAIADAALSRPELARAAALDRATLRARFAIPSSVDLARGAVPSLRRGPYVGRQATEDGGVVWVAKGVGASARVFLREARAISERERAT